MSTSKRQRLENRIVPLLRCIACHADARLTVAPDHLACPACAARYPIHNDIPVMTREPEKAMSYSHEVVVENAYSEQWMELLRRAGDGLVLDLGSGNNPNPRDNLVKLDIFPLANVDVVGMAENLPFRDGMFRLVMSGAVFEHVVSPWTSITEVRRVLAEGGDVYIETAFLQPVHAFPSHYFNMTRMGLEEVCKEFSKISSGVQPHQYPSFALKWFLEVMARKMPVHQRARFLRATVREIIGEYAAEPFSHRWMESFTSEDLEQLACGVYFYGRKTREPVRDVPALPSTTETRMTPWRRFLHRLYMRWMP